MQADRHSDEDGYFVALPLEASEHAFTVEVAADAVQFALLGRVAITRMTFTRHEARKVAYHMLRASQEIDEEEDE
jgi:hypothetical protein